MHCRKCGNSLPDNAKFCPKCGTPVQSQANKAQQTGKQSMSSTSAASNSSVQPGRNKSRNNRAFFLLGICACALVLLVAIIFVNGNRTRKSPQVSNAEMTSIPSLSTTEYSDTPTSTVAQTNSDSLLPINPFMGLQLRYAGYSGVADAVELIADEDNSLLRDNVRYSFSQEYHNLKNGDKVIVVAECDTQMFQKAGYFPECSTQEYTVKGLPEIKRAANYNEGVNWVEIKYELRKQWTLVDLDGNILFKLDEGSYPVTHFANGICIVDYDRIIDVNGNTVWSIEQDGRAYADAHWGMDNVDSIHIYNNWHTYINNTVISATEEYINEDYYGYTQVEFNVNTYEYTGPYTGFLDANGNWYLEPMQLKGNAMDAEYGVYRVGNKNGDTGFYNILTNELIWESEMARDAFYRKAAKWRCAYYEKAHNGMIYVSAGALGNYLYDGIDNINYDGNMYNSSGQKILDLSKYTRDILPYPTFTDGYMMLPLLNEQNASYYTVLDTKGNEMFAPRKKEVIPYKLSDSCSEGMFWEYREDSKLTYYKVDGSQAFELPFPMKRGTDFHEGRALVCDFDDVNYFIDEDGRLVY